MSVNLVIGASGFLGSRICRQLAAKGKPVRAAVRPSTNQARVEELEQLGAELVYANLKDPASLRAACQGSATVISTATTTASREPGDTIQSVDLAGQLELIEVAKAAGISHFSFISFSGNVEPEAPSPLTAAKRAVEEHLKQSGLGYTILRCSCFMEIWLSPALGFDYPNARATIYGSGQQPMSWVSVEDVASFAVASLDHPEAKNTVIEVGGPEALSPLEVITIFEELSGRTFALDYVAEADLAAQKEAALEPLQASFASLLLQLAKGDVIDMRETLKTFPLRLMSVRAYASRVLELAGPDTL